VHILGQEYLIKSDENEEQVQLIAQFVNEKLLEIREQAAGLSEKKSAILAAFHIASEYYELKKEHDHFLENVQNRLQGLNSQIDTVIT
jgi:cell division protein ZapA